MKVELTAEYLRRVRFTLRRGGAYDAGEVDAFMDALIAAVEARTKADTDAAYTARLEAICEIRAEMTESIMRTMLEAEKRWRRCWKPTKITDFNQFPTEFLPKYLTTVQVML